MKKALSVLLTLAIIGSIITMPAMASGTASALPADYAEAHEYFYSDFDGTALPSGFARGKGGGVTVKTVDGDTVAEWGGNTESTITYLYTPTVSNRNATSENPLANQNDLVFEFRFKSDATNESQSYFYYHATADDYANMAFMAAPSYKLQNGMNWTRSSTPVIASFDSLAEWHTISFVYPAGDQNVRKLYVDGVYYGTSDDTTNKQANVWQRIGKSRWGFMAYSETKTAKFWLDYVKAYEAPTHFIAEIENSSSTSREELVLTFNNAYGADTVNNTSFSALNGNETITVSSVERLSANKIKIRFSQILDKNTSYTLKLTGVKDNLATEVYNSEIAFTTNSEYVYAKETVYYYNTFEGTDPGLAYYLTSKEVDYRNDISEDGKSVFKVQGLDVHQNVGNPDFRTTPLKFTATNAPDELILEYKLKLNAPSEDAYLGTWANEKTSGFRSRTVALGRYEDTKDKVFFHYTDKTPISNDFTVDTSEWTTVTVVYPRDVLKRKVYINGTYLGESAEGELENTYASKRETALSLLTDFKSPEDILEVDYIKYYTKASIFDGRIIDAKSTGVTVEFNSNPANLVAENVIFSDGTAASEIKEIDEKTFIIVPAAPLSNGNISLTFKGLKDNIARDFEGNLSFEIQNNEEQVYVYSSFNESGLPANFTLISDAYKNNYTADGNGNLVLHSDGLATMFMYMPAISNPNATSADKKANLPELVYEFKCKYDYNTGETDNKYTYFTFRDKANSNFSIGAKSYSATIPATGEEVLWKLASGEKAVTSLDVNGIWHTYAIVYSNTKNERSLYIDGEYIGTSPESTASSDNYWFNNGASKAELVLYDKMKCKDTIAFDYIKAYTPAEEVEASFVSVSDDKKTVSISFNGNIAKLEPKMIKAAGQTAESIETVDFDNNIFAVKFARKLPSASTVNLTIDGAISTLGKKCYDVLSFETGEGNTFNVTVAGSDSENGKVTFTETATEDEDLPVNVKAKINYTATVTADGWVLDPDKAGNYIVRKANADTEIKVDFAETVFTEEVSKTKIPTVLSTYSYGTATWAFGSLRKEATEYGFIAAKKSDNLTLEAVTAGNAIKMQADSIDEYGDFGMMIIDKNNKFGGSYYVRPYAVYENFGTIYGTATPAGHKR